MGLPLRADGSRELIAQLVPDRLRPGDCRRGDIGKLMRIQVANFLRRKLGIGVWELLAAKFENPTEDVALHQSARPPFGWFEAGSGVGSGNSPSVPADAGEGAASAMDTDAEDDGAVDPGVTPAGGF